MKKGQVIEKIVINGDHVTVYDSEGIEVKLTRTQRHIFKHYKDWNFLDKLTDEFGNKNVLAKNYMVIKDNEVVVGGA